jgi:hypothetical protein
MSGPKRNPDSLNTIGVVVVGICGAVMVYVSITALQAFYMNDTSELQTMQDYGGQDTTAKSHKAEEMRNIYEPQIGTPSITIDKAMDLIVRDAKQHPDHLVPSVQVGSDGQAFKPKATEVAHSGAPELLVVTPPPAAAAGTGAGSGSGSGSGAGAGAGAGSGSGAASPAGNTTDGKKTTPAGGQVDNNNVNTQLHSTGSPADKTHPVPGAGGAPASGQGSAQRLVPGGHAP